MADTATKARETELGARYGRTPRKKRRNRVIMVMAAVLFVAVLTIWIVWAGLGNSQGNLETQDIGHKVIDDYSVSITWQVSVSAGTSVSCALQAQNEAHAIVGWEIVALPASTKHSRQYTETLRTSQHAVTGLIYRCWLT